MTSSKAKNAMRPLALGLLGHLLLSACSSPPAQDTPPSAPATMFEGARVIVGDGSAPIENAVILVEHDRITRVGRRGAIAVPPGAARVDLTGTTVIPALVDAHSHIGYMKNLTSGPQNYTREHILDHMYRFAYHGVAASQAMGSDFGDVWYGLRDEIQAGQYPDAARFLTAGRGLAPEDEVKPDNMRHSAYIIRTAADVRTAVQELAERNVKIVKTWVDDRGGSVRKLPPELYTAIIDEAHKRKLRVAVHATGLADAKALLRAGVDIFAHMIGDVDDELVELFRQHPTTAVLSALGGPRREIYAPWLNPVHPLIAETVRPEQIKRLHDRLASETPEARARGEANWARLAAGLRRLNDAGVPIGAGTDGGGQLGDQFIGWTMHTEVENLVAAGMTPAQALVAATRTSAEILGLDALGTIAPGKSADIVVLAANPLDDITNTRRIARVYLRGKEVDRVRMRAGWTGARVN